MAAMEASVDFSVYPKNSSGVKVKYAEQRELQSQRSVE